MRLVIAMMKHETNTFSPVPTPFSRFEEWGAQFGEAARKAYEHTAMPMAAYIKLARENGAEFVTPFAGEAMPSGVVTAAAYECMSEAILDAVRDGCDAALLDLHGAMVAANTPDGEGTLLARIREIAPDLPIAVTCDLHCNLTAQMIDNCTALIGYKTYPHVDMYEVAEQVGRILFRHLAGEINASMAWGNRPVLAQTLRMGTDDEPMKSLIDLAKMAESSGEALAATVFGGFPLADIPEAGLSSVVITDNDAAKAAEVRDRILDAAWSERSEFVYQGEPLSDAVARAKTLEAPVGDNPVILLDHADNTGSGGTQDTMHVIAEVLRQDLDDVAVAAVWDPHAVKVLQKAGIGSRVTIDLGGRMDMPSIGRQGEPLSVSGTVTTLTDGNWIVRGPMYTGVEVHMGPTAVLDTGKVQIVITSRHHEPWDQGVFTSVGIDPKYKKYLVLKSRIHYRAGFAAIERETVTCDGVGVTTSDNDQLDFQHVRRPIYPLDLINEP